MNVCLAVQNLNFMHARVRIEARGGDMAVNWACECGADADKTVKGSFTLDAWNADSQKVTIYDIADFCRNCGQVLVNPLLFEFYALIGKGIRMFLKTHPGCALWGFTHLLKQFSEHLIDSDFILIDRNPPFSAADWEPFEEALGDRRIMTEILSRRPIFTSLPRDRKIETVIVLTNAHHDAIQAEIQAADPGIRVMRYADVLRWNPDAGGQAKAAEAARP